LRIGVKNQSIMEAKDGSFGFDFILVYDQILEHCEISYTMEENQLHFLKVMVKKKISLQSSIQKMKIHMKFNNLIDKHF
jgi:hypothetical protein